jgi:hypothetical protein
MPQFSYSDITQFKLAPIYRLWLVVDPPAPGWSIEDAPSTGVATTALQLTHTEIESNVQITPITRRTMYGGDRQVGQQLQATIYTSVADYTDLHNLLSNFVGRRVSAKIQFGGHRSAPSIAGMSPQGELPGYQTLFLYLTKLDAWDARVEINYRVEPAELRLRTVITITAQLPAGSGMANLLTDNDTSYWS